MKTPFPIWVVGVNHCQAPMPELESILLPQDRISGCLHELAALSGIREVVLLSTCNRTEVYITGDADGETGQTVSSWLQQQSRGKILADRHIYVHQHEVAVKHLFSVACGLNSMMLGETEIVGQMQHALDCAVAEGTATGGIVDVFTAAFRVSKRARCETSIDRGTMSVGSTTVQMAEQVTGSLAQKALLLVGAGETAALIAGYLRNKDVRLQIVNRTFQKARKLASETGGRAVTMDCLEDAVTQADVVITATSAPAPLISRQMIEQVRSRRGERSLNIVDIAMPHNVDPDVGAIPGVSLMGMIDLTDRLKQNRSMREAEIPKVEEIIREEVAIFLERRRILEQGPLISALRQSFHTIRTSELSKMQHRFSPEDRELLETVTRRIVNRLLHPPIVAIRGFDETDTGPVDRARWVADLFGLPGARDDRKPLP